MGTDCRKLARSFSRRDVGHQDARGRAKVACRRLYHLFEVIGIPDHRVVSVRRADSRADAHGGRGLFAASGADQIRDSGAQVGELRVMLIAAPGTEVGGLKPPEAEGRLNLFYQHWDQAAPPGAAVGLFAHPARCDRVAGP